MGLKSLRLINLKVFVSHNKSFVFLSFLSIVSAIIGIFSFKASLSPFTVLELADKGFTYIFLRCFVLSVAFVASYLLSSLFLLGSVLVMATTVFFWMGIGYSSCSAAYVFGFSGLIANALCVALPFAACFVLICLFSAKTVKLSFLMYSKLLGGSAGAMYQDEFKRYLLLSLVMFLILIIFDAVFSLILMFASNILKLI